MRHEPTHLEVFLTKLAFFFCGRSVYGEFADHLPLAGCERVLDFGCGMGTVAYYTAKKLARGQLICLDISARWLRVCRRTLRKYKNVVFEQSGPGCPKLPEESFDIVYCHFVLHELSKEELDEAVFTLAKALKPGGALVFREPLNEADALNALKRLTVQNGLLLKVSRVTDIPLMGNALESGYIKL